LPARARDRPWPARPGRAVRWRRFPRSLRARGCGRGRRGRLRGTPRQLLPAPVRGRRLPRPRVALLAGAGARARHHHARAGLNGIHTRLRPPSPRAPGPLRYAAMHQTGVRPMIYQLHEFNRQLLAPFTELAQANAKIFGSDGTWLSSLPGATRVAAANELLHRIGKDYEKPAFGIHQVVKDGHDVPVVEKVALERPFCRLLRFKRYTD